MALRQLALVGVTAAVGLVAAASAGSPSFPALSDLRGAAYNVSYDKRAITINGEHALFISGSVHPPRGTTDDWDTWFKTARVNGLNMVEVRRRFARRRPLPGLRPHTTVALPSLTPAFPTTTTNSTVMVCVAPARFLSFLQAARRLLLSLGVPAAIA
jgi:hypothetical protein